MKKIYFLFIACITIVVSAHAQGGVAINTTGIAPDSSAVLDVSSVFKGALMPRMSTAQRNAIDNPAYGLTIFNTDCGVYNFNYGTPQAPNWATLNSSNALVAGVSIAANPLGAVCAGSAVTFTATPSQNNLSPSYQWKVNGNNMGSNSSIFVDSTLNNGDVVSCVLSSSVACVTGSPATSNSITMLVNIVPAITGTTPASFCAGSAVTLSASANLGTINWYDSTTGGSSLSSGASFTVSGLTSSTTYYIDATANGCTTASRTPVKATYYASPANQPDSIAGPTNDSVGEELMYSISPENSANDYIWTVNLGTIISGQGSDSINVLWNLPGTGTVSVTANNPCGASTAQTKNVVSPSQTFNATSTGYTGSLQYFTAPYTTTYLVIAYGAQGGNANNTGGYGAEIQGMFSLTQGQELTMLVGQQGASPGVNNGSGGGGGGSFVLLNGTLLVAAGGGGGGGASFAGGAGQSTTTGGNSTGGNASYGGTVNGGGNAGSGGNYQGGGGGGATCCNGQDGNNGGGLGGGGGAGYTGNGGAGENNNDGTCVAYSYVNGGNAGYHNDSFGNAGNSYGGYGGGGNGVYYDYQSGGGGGGGYTGGGGGSGVGVGGGGGGGGSYNGSTNQNNQSGVQSGNGQVVIMW